MKRIFSIVITSSILMFGCTDNKSIEELKQVKAELNTAKEELTNCSSELDNLKNTVDQRELRAKKHLSEENYKSARKEYQGILDNYAGTEQAKSAELEISKIDNLIEKKRIEEERKKTLGFKALKESTTIKTNKTTLKFSSVQIAKRWTFDSYGDEYHYRDAERGNKNILARVSVSSDDNNPDLPPVQAYHIKKGKLKYLGTLRYEFVRWKDYGAYLGNYADYGNDFAHSGSVKFSIGLSVAETSIDNEAVFLVVGNKGCFDRRKATGRPEIEYVSSSCPSKPTLKVEDFDNDYKLVKIFNKSKL